jgi:hypothetical protein
MDHMARRGGEVQVEGSPRLSGSQVDWLEDSNFCTTRSENHKLGGLEGGTVLLGSVRGGPGCNFWEREVFRPARVWRGWLGQLE